jgi:hypothetical protein
MFWILAGIDPSNEDTGQYPDYDHFSVYNLPDDESAQLIRQYASQFPGSARACELAVQGGVKGPSTPFVSALKRSSAVAYSLPAGRGRGEPELPLAVSWLE